MSNAEPVTRPKGHLGNIVLPVGVLAVAAVFLVQATGFPSRAGDGDVGPAGLPCLWIAFPTLFSVTPIVPAVLKRMPPDPVPGRWVFVPGYVDGRGLCLAGIDWLGYYSSPLVSLVAAMYLLDAREPHVVLSVAVGWFLFSRQDFAGLLHVNLPEGALMS